MQRRCITVELWLAKHWRKFALLTGALLLVSCAYSQFTPSGELETVGQDLIPGVSVGADVIGAVVDAAKDVPVGEVVDAVQGGSWWNLIGIVLAFGGAVSGGVIARKKWRQKKAGA